MSAERVVNVTINVTQDSGIYLRGPLGTAETEFGLMQITMSTGAKLIAAVAGAQYSIAPGDLAEAFVDAHATFLAEDEASVPAPLAGGEDR